MENLERIKFAVGEEYKNEKGLFEVIALKGEEMVIRWQDGEEITCDMRVQRRIQERRRWEKRRREKMAISNLQSASAAKAKLPFKGLQAEDFKDNLSRTPWRNRSQLGGAVSRLQYAKQPHFNSWAAKRRNEVHWADARHWKDRQAACGVKFSARATGAAFAWGLIISRPRPKTGASEEWKAFVEWLGKGENEARLHEVAVDAGLKVYDVSQAGVADLLTPGDSGWVAENQNPPLRFDSLRRAIDQLPGVDGSDLMIAMKVSKEDALDRGKDIARDVSAVIDGLQPIYAAISGYSG